MRYFLKQNLPGIKAGVEVVKTVGLTGWGGLEWHVKSSEKKFEIPPSELSDWIEERDGMWKPKEGEAYYIPRPDTRRKYDVRHWFGDGCDRRALAGGLVCPTPELVIELADRQIETAKKFWEEKK